MVVGTYSEGSWLEMGLYSSVARWVVGKIVFVVVAVALVAAAYFAAFEASYPEAVVVVAFLFAHKFALPALLASAVVVVFAFELALVLELALPPSLSGSWFLVLYLTPVECNLGASASFRRLRLRPLLHLISWPL